MIRSWTWALLGLALVMTPPAIAQQKAPEKPDIHPVIGPQKVTLGANMAVVDLPGDFVFINGEESRKLLKQQTGVAWDGCVGLILPRGEEQFEILLQYEDCGYVRDDDAGKLDADAIFKQIKESNDEANDEKKENGFPTLDIVKWSEPPRYVAAEHHVVWGLVVKGQRGESVNYNTRILGRHGVLSMNLVAKTDKIDQYKPRIDTLLKATTFNAGERYAEFVKGQDKDSGMGLTGLVLGGTALALGVKLVKMGFLWKLLAPLFKLFAPLLKLLAAAWKAVVVLLAGIASKLKSLFGGGKSKDEQPPAA